MNPQPPTDDQIEKNAWIEWDIGPRHYRGFACWYPQMGGYVARCIVVIEPTDSREGGPCFEAYVWHDGEFPFGEEDRSPAVIHHCSAEQFIEFGELVQGMS